MLELSMHILDIVENSVAAGAKNVSISIGEYSDRDAFVVEIKDDGQGMDEEMLKKALDPFVTTKLGKKVGLGLSMLAEAARKADGDMSVESSPGGGTTVRATFGLTHVDRQPLGNMIETMITLIIGCPDVEFSYTHIKDGEEFTWNTGRIRDVFGDVIRSQPEVVDFIQKEFAVDYIHE
jgi:hypothetical protein